MYQLSADSVLQQNRELVGREGLKDMSHPDRVRVLVVGDSGVGKTSLTSVIAHSQSLSSWLSRYYNYHQTW